MSRPNIYGLGTTTEILLTVYDNDGIAVIPSEARLSIDTPNDIHIVVSGSDMTQEATYLSYLYTPTVSGWYEYEAWVRDDTGRQTTKYAAFCVVDHILF